MVEILTDNDVVNDVREIPGRFALNGAERTIGFEVRGDFHGWKRMTWKMIVGGRRGRVWGDGLKCFEELVDPAKC